MNVPAFKPAWWLPSAHLQTIWPALFRKKPRIQLHRERVELADGDFIDLDWYGKATDPLVLIIHGLEGSIRSHYATTLMSSLHDAGFATVFMHFRNCSEQPNRLPRAYHSGETGDLQIISRHILNKHHRAVFAAIGFSLGGNALLKWLGETGRENPLTCAAAISVPFQLAQSATKLNSGFSRLYQRYLLSALKQSYLKKFTMMRSPLQIDVTQLDSFWAFDDKVTAPLHGFANVHDYYKQSSCRQHLQHIQKPTCIIHAADDPFMYPDSIPRADEISAAIEMHVTEYGGHVGFVSGRFPWRARYWHETVICQFLTNRLRDKSE